MTITNRIIRLVKTIIELGFKKSAYFGTYQLAKGSGFYLHFDRMPKIDFDSFVEPDWIHHIFENPEALKTQLAPAQIEDILKSADQITTGEMLAFGMIPTPITFDDQRSAKHWSKISDNFSDGDDIKLHWEPARFSWVFPLIQAYHLTKDEKYFVTFKRFTQEFVQKNPYSFGIQWLSAQEVALRMIALICAYSIFFNPIQMDEEFRKQIIQQIWQHANRIPQTIFYARAQNNNHLLSDALGIMYAGAFFNTTPIGKKWLKEGWVIFSETIQNQIQSNGTYVQQSMNYHRLMMTECIWAKKIGELCGLSFPEKSLQSIQQAAQWLHQFVEPISGQAPNLGHNDGSLLFPISNPAYVVYGSISKTCSLLFSEQEKTETTDMMMWLGLQPGNQCSSENVQPVPFLRNQDIFMYLRAETFPDRPAHADQNHADIWFNGENVAQDAGTYRYTDVFPWNNGLAHTINHNTITIDDIDQMTWAGRFRWLDWSHGKYLPDECNEHQIAAIHDGYIKKGILHKRIIRVVSQTRIEVEDQLIPQHAKASINICRLHWLLPDGIWNVDPKGFSMKTRQNQFMLGIYQKENESLQAMPYTILRCGNLLHGNTDKKFPTLGWFSPGYQVKLPAVSLLATFETPVLPLTIVSIWERKEYEEED